LPDKYLGKEQSRKSKEEMHKLAEELVEMQEGEYDCTESPR
jgi:non-homologous end joining protein Ku